MVLRTGQNKCSNHIESGFLHENASAKTTTIKIVCEKWGLGYHYLSGKAMVFPLVIYRCESWTIKKAEHWTLVLEKTLESPLVSKEIKPVNPKGNQPWIFFRRTDGEAEVQYFGHLMWRADSVEKSLILGKIESRREGDDRGGDGWMVSLTQQTWVWANSGRWWRTGKPGMLQSVGSQIVGQTFTSSQ